MAQQAEVQIATRVPRVMGDKLAKLAERNQRSLAAELRVALERHLSSSKKNAQ